MKKALLWLLLLTIPFTFGCPSPRNDNAVNTNAANTNTGNTNQGINPDRSDKKNKAIQIAVYEDKQGVKKVAIIPQSIYLSRGKNHHLRFSAFNGLDVKITKIEVTLEHETNTGLDPFEDDDGKVFVIEEIKVGEEDDSVKGFRKIKKDPQDEKKYDGKYNIKIKVYVENQTDPINTIDTCPDTGVKFYAPQIEIGG